MTEITEIRKMYFEDGKNISQIQNKTGFDRKTIRKFINKKDWNTPVQVLTERESKLNKFKLEIDQWLEADKEMRKKQRHSARRVHDRLKEKHSDEFDCSYRTVAKYVREKKKSLYANKQCFLPLEHKPGEAENRLRQGRVCRKWNKILVPLTLMSLSHTAMLVICSYSKARILNVYQKVW